MHNETLRETFVPKGVKFDVLEVADFECNRTGKQVLERFWILWFFVQFEHRLVRQGWRFTKKALLSSAEIDLDALSCVSYPSSYGMSIMPPQLRTFAVRCGRLMSKTGTENVSAGITKVFIQ